MTYCPTSNRLFAVDTGRTPAERADARRYWATNTPALFDLAADPDPVCPVCSGEHREDDCPHGTAPALFPTTQGDTP